MIEKPTVFQNKFWLVCAITSAVCYATYNTVNATYIRTNGVFACKAVNSIVLGVVALGIRVFGTRSPITKTKPIVFSWLCGFLNVTGITLLFASFHVARETGSNLGVSSAILSGCILWGLFGSKCVYNEEISTIKLSGAFVLMVSICTVAISA